jgi:hypothetical protein
MIHIDFSQDIVQVEPDGDTNQHVRIETLETPHSISQIRTASNRFIEETVRARTAGGRVSREYDITRVGDLYFVTSGMRDTTYSRTFAISIGDVGEDGSTTMVVQSGPRSQWIVEDQLVQYDGREPLTITVNQHALTSVQNGPVQEFHRSTAWERLLGDDDESV